MEIRRNGYTQIADEQSAHEAYKKKIRSDHYKEVQDIEEQSVRDIAKTEQSSMKVKGDAERAYNLDFSRQAERHQKDLNMQREQFEKELALQKKEYETKFEKLRELEIKRVEDYKKKQEDVIARLHEKYQEAMRDLEDRHSDT